MSKNSCVLSLLFALSALQGVSYASDVTPEIVGGRRTTMGEYPFMVELVATGQPAHSGQTCGGSYLGGKWVLTAAHCFARFGTAGLEVIFKIHNLDKETEQGIRVPIKYRFQHELYSNPHSYDNDIALLEIAQPVDAGTITTATEAEFNALPTGSNLTVIGWGDLSNHPKKIPTILHEVDVPLADHALCQSNYGGPTIITDTMLCAGFFDGGKDSCIGDSGGPLFTGDGPTLRQVGIVSWGYDCAIPKYLGVYTRLSLYKDWIDQRRNGLFANPQIDFGYILERKHPQLVAIFENNSAIAAQIVNAQISGAAATAFTITHDGCAGKRLPAGAECSVHIKAELTEYGDDNEAQLDLLVNSPQMPVLSSKLSSHILVTHH